MADDSRDGVLSPSDCESDSELMAEAPNGSRSVCSKEPAWSSFGPRPLRKWVRKLRTKRAYSPQVDAADENADAGRSANGCDGSAASSLPPPRDRFNLVYFCMLLAGVGFLLPWSSYISAIDYFKDYLYGRDFPRVSEAIPLTYLFSTLFSAMFSVVVVNRFPRHGRIAFGYVTFSVSLLFVPLLDIGINNCTVSTRVSYYLTLLTVVLVGLGSGVQQASYYGLAGLLPRRYSQAVMAGESIAGVVVSISRIVTKAAVKSERAGTMAFFGISLLFIFACVCCQLFIRSSPFVRFHVDECKKMGRRREMRRNGSENGDSVPLESFMSEPSEPEDSDQRGLIDESERKERGSGGGGGGRARGHWMSEFWSGVKLRGIVIRQVWRLIAAIFITYLITLLLFPGLISEVQDCRLGDWTAVLLVAVFNFVDLAAKWLALLPVRWSPTGLLVGSLLRLPLIPLLLLLISPSPSSPVLSNGTLVWAVLITFVLGLSNGYFGSLSMINMSGEVEEHSQKELAGTILTWFLLLGLTVGSVLGYAFSPLTGLAEHTLCNTTQATAFTRCLPGNSSTGS